MNRLARRAAGAALLALAACAKPSSSAPVPQEPPVRADVTNGFAIPVRVEVVGAGSVFRLGTVLPGMSASFPIPPALTLGGSVEIVVDAGRSDQPFRSGPLLLAAGAVLRVQVASRLFNSTATVEP